MNRVKIDECGLEAEGLSCRQRGDSKVVGLRMRVRPHHTAGYGSIKAVAFEDSNHVSVEKAWLRRLRDGDGFCAFCESPCKLEVVSRDAPEPVEDFGQAFSKLFDL